MRFPLTLWDRIYFALAAAGGATYVYRFATPVGNVSLFRVAIIAGAILVLVRWARYGLDRAVLWLLPFLAAATLGPSIDFIRMPEDSLHRIELLAYFVNLAGMTVMFSAVSSRAALLRALRWFCYAAWAAIVTGWYAWATGAIPAEELLRLYGSEYAKELAYLNVGDETIRLTGSFHDPNFFGAYLVLTIAICQVLWSAERRKRWLILATACALSMLVTTSRTALLGLVALVVFGDEHNLRSVAKRVFVLVGTLVVVVPIIGLLWDGFYERLFSTDLARLDFLARGWDAFAQDPLFGEGASGLEDPETGHSSAHMFYLSAVAKYGIVGGILLLLFVFWPLLAAFSRRMEPLSRRLVLSILFPLAAMYLTYDFYLFLEFQFLLFGMVYAVTLRGISVGPPILSTHWNQPAGSLRDLSNSKPSRTLTVVSPQ